jgi:calcineurin-like phosphoesterase family protein
MNKNYFIIADNHFGHTRIIDHCQRPFHDVKMMDDYMVMRWNQVVKTNDIVYHLGDLFWNEKSAIDILPKLNGEIHLILGNHDKNWKRIRKRLERSPFNPSSNLIVEEKDIVTIKEPIQAVLCHYPLMSWNGAAHGVWHFSGHTHNNNCLSERRRVNVCVENIDYTPINLNIFFRSCKSIEEVRLYNKEIVL